MKLIHRTWYLILGTCYLILFPSCLSSDRSWFYLFPDSCRRYLWPYTCYMILATWYMLPNTCYLILVTWYLSPDNCYLILSTCYLILISWYLFPNTWCKIGSLTLVNNVLPHYFLFNPIKLCLTTLKPTWTHLVLLNPCFSPFDN